MSQNGKGDTPRPVNYKKYSQNWQEINWGRSIKCDKHVNCSECGGEGKVDSGGFTPWQEPIFLPCPLCEKLESTDCPYCGKDYGNCGCQDKYVGLDISDVT